MSPAAPPPLHAAAIRFVLVEPQTAGNIGASARALKNFGFDRLVLVRPAADPLAAEARALAVNASDLLDDVAVHGTLDEALAGAATVVGTSARRGKQRRPHERLDHIASGIAGAASGGEVAIVFGREDHGLNDRELDRCTHLVYFPSDAAYPSLNLAQAVLLVAWELRRAGLVAPTDRFPPTATHEVREAFYEHLEQALRAIGFVHEETSESILRRLRRLYGRAGMTEEEVATLRGMARQILWAAGRAGLTPPDGESS